MQVTAEQAKRLMHIKAHLDNGFDVDQLAGHVRNGTGNPRAWLMSLASHAEASARQDGKRVRVEVAPVSQVRDECPSRSGFVTEVSPVYSGSSQVPAKIEVVYWIDRQRVVQTFRN